MDIFVDLSAAEGKRNTENYIPIRDIDLGNGQRVVVGNDQDASIGKCITLPLYCKSRMPIHSLGNIGTPS
jgi:hypothetical protein